MVTFSCDLCADAVKKPKAVQHMMRCRATMTCVDCGKVFDANSVNMHNSCVSEAEKYQGKLYAGPKHSEGNAQGSCAPAASIDQSLIRGPPWLCKMCNVSCSGRDNLIAHHQSKKHVNKAKHLASAISAPNSSIANQNVPSENVSPLNSAEAPSHVAARGATDSDTGNKEMKRKKDKKEKKEKKQTKDKKDKKEKKQTKDKKEKKVKSENEGKHKKESKELQGIAKPKKS
jgi:hypothetical protein